MEGGAFDAPPPPAQELQKSPGGIGLKQMFGKLLDFQPLYSSAIIHRILTQTIFL